ncbi:MAG: hypothetical protein JWN43_16 [Gammaproteobacteria bacterium]|nr:hypothetical protein [Gammaproteobacteria bacterium]
MWTLRRALALVLFVLGFGTFDARAVEYSIIPVSAGTAVGINNYGDIAGNNSGRAFVWTYKTRSSQVIRTLGGSGNQASAINDCGEVVGLSSLAGDKDAHAFVWYQGYVSDLDPHGVGIVANAINNAGVIVGSVGIGTGMRPATVRPGKPVVIDSHGFEGAFTAISLSGAVAGYRIPPADPNGGPGGGVPHTFLLEGGVITNISGLPDSAPFWFWDRPSGINDHGDVVGTTYDRYGSAGFVVYHDDGYQTPVGTFAPKPGFDRTFTGGINDSGVIVGVSTPDYVTEHAFVTRAGRLEDLNTLIDPKDPLARYVTLNIPTKVNDSGWILATGTDSRSGAQGAYLLTVKDPPIQLQRVTGGCSHH